MKQKKISFEYIFGSIMIFLFAVMSMTLSFNNNIWTDEAFTMQLLGEDFIGILRGTAADVHPPLYYLIAKVSQNLFGDSLLVQKFTAIIPTILTLIVGGHHVRKKWGDRAFSVFICMLVSSPQLFRYSVQVRMYSWALFFVTMCGIYAFYAFFSSSKKNWFAVLFFGLAAAYTHYFALVTVCVLYAFLLMFCLFQKREKIKDWLVLAILSFLLYSPWFLVWINQMKNVTASYWIPEMNWKIFLGYFIFLFDGSLPYSELLYGAFFTIIFLIYMLEKQNGTFSKLPFICISIPILVIIIGVLLSELLRPIYYNRYIFPCVAITMISLAICLRNISKRNMILIFALSITLGVLSYQETFREEYLSTKVEETLDFFEKNLENQDRIVYNMEVYGFIYEYYWPKEKLTYVEDMDFAGDFHTIWYLDTYNYTYLPDEILLNNNLKKEMVGKYGIEQNEFYIYKISKNE